MCICTHGICSLNILRDADTFEFEAIATLNGHNIFGTVRFIQSTLGGWTVIRGDIKGLEIGKHGIHIHEYGDLSNGCNSTGSCYNPIHKKHSKRDADIRIGNLGNIVTESREKSIINIVSPIVSLVGKYSVIGRALVIKRDPYDLGRGNVLESLTIGNSGQGIACGVIGLTESTKTT